jgi:putative membrane protein
MKKNERGFGRNVFGPLVVIVIMAGLLMNCRKSKDSQSSLNNTDLHFMMNASYSNEDEIDAGGLAAIKGSNAGVKMFGAMMVDDHTTAETELKHLADSLVVTIPQQPDSLHMAIKDTLNGLSGMAFDTMYIHGQVKDHQNTIDLFQTEISAGRNDAVKQYANKYLPKIQMHLMMADSLMNVLNTP